MTEFQKFLRKLSDCRLEQEIERAEVSLAEAHAETAWTAKERSRNLDTAKCLCQALQAESQRRTAQH